MVIAGEMHKGRQGFQRRCAEWFGLVWSLVGRRLHRRAVARKLQGAHASAIRQERLMPRPTPFKEVRRRDFELAAYAAIRKYGFHNVTVAQVAAQLGMSQGNIHYYFKSKDELLEKAVRHMSLLLSGALLKALRQARTPRERLDAVIEGNLAPDVFDPPNARFWMAFGEQPRKSARQRRLQRVLERRTYSNFMAPLAQLVSPRSEAATLADELTLIVNGLWVRMATGEPPITRDEAVATARRFIDRELAARSRMPAGSPSSRKRLR